MAIDNFTDNGIKIQDLILKEPKKPDGIFDPRRDLIDSDWEQFGKLLSMEDNSNTPGTRMLNFFIDAGRIHLLAPDKTPKFVFEEKYKNVGLDQLHSEWDMMSYQYFMQLGGFMRTLYHDIPMSEFLPEETENTLFRRELGNIENTKDHPSKDYVYTLLMELGELKKIKPEFTRSFIDLGWLKENAIKYSKELLENSNSTGALEDFVRFVPNILILFPDSKKELGLSPAHWEKMNDRLDVIRRVSARTLLSYSSNLAIIAADEIRIDNKGTRLIYHSNRNESQEDQNPPEVRKF
jgi:hypothetical protein